MNISVTKHAGLVEFRIKPTDVSLHDIGFTLDMSKYSAGAVQFGLEMLRKECEALLGEFMFMPANNATEEVMMHKIETKFYDYVYWADFGREKYNLSLTYEGYQAYVHNREIETALDALNGGSGEAAINTILL